MSFPFSSLSDPPSQPSPPLNLQLSTITSRSVSISWEKPSDIGGLQILGYTIEVTHHGRDDCTFVDQISNITTNATVTQLVIILRPYSQYSVAVYAFNSMGHSNATEGLDMFWTLEEGTAILIHVQWNLHIKDTLGQDILKCWPL